jgi:diadenylate cyclase
MRATLERLLEAALAGAQAFFDREPWLVARDGIDIAITAVLVYLALVVIRGTRAMQVAIGMALVGIAYAFAKRAGLITIWTLLDSVLTWVVLIVVIIFQTDIRRALARVGGGPFFSRQRTAQETGVLEEIVKAAGALAQRRIGALLVFERAIGLDELIEHGSRIDAEVSKELLYTIFIPSFENPMHDGAVIIRGGRVAEAGAFLPLAGTGGRDRTLGARHRAAIGITEESDAVAVVVSEERGALSVCFDGNIVRNLDTDSLRDALYGLFYRQPAPKKKKITGERLREARASVPAPTPASAAIAPGDSALEKPSKQNEGDA